MKKLISKLVELENMLLEDGYNSSNVVIQLLNEIQKQVVKASVKQKINKIVCSECRMIKKNKLEDEIKSENEIASNKFEKYLDEFFEMMTISKPLASTQDSMLHAIEFGYWKGVNENKNTMKSQTLSSNNPNILGKFIVNYNEKTKELEVSVNDFVHNYLRILPKSDNGIILRARLREF